MATNLFSKIKDGLSKTRKNISDSLNYVWDSFRHVNDEFYDELEEALILADMGALTTSGIIDELRDYAKSNKITDTALLRTELKRIIQSKVSIIPDQPDYPCVMLIIGVNGVGKTTAIGKMASYYKSEGRSITLAAADTFRAAAGDQLKIWGDRSGVQVIKYSDDGADPAAVVYDAIDSAKAKKTELLICDTAGRLHNKKNLMSELEKINRVIDREYPQACRRTYLVIDATTGQNAVSQAKTFSEILHIDGIILTKLDGTAKGGIVVCICDELKLPIVFIGVGEGIDDLQPFDPAAFVENLF